MLLCGVLVVLGSQMVSGQGDAWLIKISSSIYGLPANQAEILSDRNSSRFREEQKFFCGKINAIFQAEPVVGNPVKERYNQCRIDQFQQSNTHTDAPVSFTYTLVFNGSDPIPKPIVDGLIAGNTETYQFGNKVWTLVGDWLISRINVQMRPGNLSDYMVLGKITRSHAQTDVSTYVDLKTELMNITTTDVMDPASDAFSTVSRSVCKEVSRYLAVGRFPSYTGCNITSIVNNTVEGRIVMNVRLTFRLDHNVIFPHLVAAVIAELAPRVAIGGHIAFKLGSVLVSETSLLDTVPGRAPEPQDRLDGNFNPDHVTS